MPKMKRPKLKDMNDLEFARFRILQARRRARRAISHLDHLPDTAYTERTAEIERVRDRARSIIAVTKPGWVSKAQMTQCVAVLRFIAGGPDTLN
jgi:hypothetical protein